MSQFDHVLFRTVCLEITLVAWRGLERFRNAILIDVARRSPNTLYGHQVTKQFTKEWLFSRRLLNVCESNVYGVTAKYLFGNIVKLLILYEAVLWGAQVNFCCFFFFSNSSINQYDKGKLKKKRKNKIPKACMICLKKSLLLVNKWN